MGKSVPMARSSLRRRAEQSFQDHFGSSPNLFVMAPGRVNLIGEHTDYNEGLVLPMAIERGLFLAASESSTRPARLRVFAAELGQVAELSSTEPLTRVPGCFANYLRGVLAGFLARGCPFPSLDIAIVSDIPLGGGLSSSAALEVATATLFETVFGFTLERTEKALLCQRAEHEFAGVPCGLMDQLACVFGEKDAALLIDCRDNRATPIRLADPELGILIANSKVRHSLADGEYAKRRAECRAAAHALGVASLRDAQLEQLDTALSDQPVLNRRARHVITENRRTRDFAEALERRDFVAAGRLMGESHASLRDDYQVSCTELDVLVELAQSLGPTRGVYGSRMTGGGFGGSTVSLVVAAQLTSIMSELLSGYEARTGRVAQLFLSRPAQGCHRLA